MKHVVIIGKYYPPEWGGVERYVYDVARLAAKTYRVTVLVHNKRNEDCVENEPQFANHPLRDEQDYKGQPISPVHVGHFDPLNRIWYISMRRTFGPPRCS